MDDSLSRGHAFDWQNVQSPSLSGHSHDRDTLFKTPQIDLPPAALDKLHSLFPKSDDFDIPSLDFGIVEDGQDINTETSSQSIDNASATESLDDRTASDIWESDNVLSPCKRGNDFHIWEGFVKNEAIPKAPYNLSEAGPEVFDAILAQSSASAPNRGVLPQDIMLRALCNLALGRSSIFFSWDKTKMRFIHTWSDVPISGLSYESCSSFIEQIADYGSTYRALIDVATAKAAQAGGCTAMIALMSCVRIISDSVEYNITRSMVNVRSLLQLQRLIHAPAQLIKSLRRLVDSVCDANTDEEVISRLADDVHDLACAGSPFTVLLNGVLTRTSAPWLDRLSTDLGLFRLGFPTRPDHQFTHRQNLLATYADEDALVCIGKAPFVSAEDHRMIVETKASIGLLRQHYPDYDLGRPLRESSLLLSPEGPNESNMDIANTYFRPNAEENDKYLADLDARMGQPLSTIHKNSDPLLEIVDISITRGAANWVPTTRLEVSDLPFDPIDKIRLRLQAQHRIVNQALLEHMFNDLQLLRHLDLQRQFHLFGNGSFVSRLCTALFSVDTQSAERRRGNIPTGQTMGLRLGTRDGQRWPPASSELRLTLAGILSETVNTSFGGRQNPHGSNELSGCLSFSIRELPDEHIKKVGNASSLQALDFLRLSYTPPPPLDAILTLASMKAYDEIFCFVLRSIRVLHVTTILRESSLRKQRNQVTAADIQLKAKFAIEAHVLASALLSYTMDIGIQNPWQKFTLAVQGVERSLKADEPVRPRSRSGELLPLGLDGLRRLHEDCLNHIRQRLFLRRKSEKLLLAVENVLAAILSCASCMEGDGVGAQSVDFSTSYEQFRLALDSLVLSLSDAAAGATKSSRSGAWTNEDFDGLRTLVAKLSWN